MSDPEEKERHHRRRKRSLLARELQDKKYRPRVVSLRDKDVLEDKKRISIRDLFEGEE